MRTFRFIALALLGIFLAHPVSAAPLPPGVDLGYLIPGDTGTVDFYQENYAGNKDLYDSASGTLAAYSKIVFSFTLDAGSAEPGSIYAGSSYNDGASSYDVSIFSTGNLVTGSTSNLLVTVLADLDAKLGTVIIENYSSYIVDFFAYLLGGNGNSIKDVVTTYAVSSVPLPPSVLLFLSGILMVSFFVARRKAFDRI